MAIFVRENAPLKFRMRSSSERQKVKELVIAGGGLFLDDDVDADDVYDIVPKGGAVTRKPSVAVQFVFKSAVNHSRLNLQNFMLDGSASKSKRTSPRLFWTEAEEVSLVEWLLKNKPENLRGSNIWEDLVKSAHLQRSPSAAERRFFEHIRPRLSSLRERINPKLVEKMDQLSASPLQETRGKGDRKDEAAIVVKGKSDGEEVDETMDVAPENCEAASHALTEGAVIPSLARKLSFDEERVEEGEKEAEEDVTFIDVVGFTQTQFPMRMNDADAEISPPVETNQAEDFTCSPLNQPVQPNQPSLPALKESVVVAKEPSDLVTPSADEESKRLASLKKPLSLLSTESSILLSNRPVGWSSRESDENDPSNATMHSFERLFHFEPSTPKRAASQSAVKQAETLEEVIEELSSFYEISSEVAMKALKDSSYSVKKAICRILRGKPVETIATVQKPTR